VRGNTSGASSTGVFGQGDFAGVQGFTTAANGFGTSGIASGAGGHAVEPSAATRLRSSRRSSSGKKAHRRA
jgi:hypothetical protein